MITINKTSNRELVIKNNGIEIKTLFIDNKIRLSKKEIAKLFLIKKSEIRKNIKLIKNEAILNLDKNIIKKYIKSDKKNKSFYSLDFIISIGYRLKSYKETKFIVNSNKLIKEYNKSRGKNNNRINNSHKFLDKIIDFFNTRIDIKP